MSQTATIQIKISPDLKAEAINLFGEIGLTLTDAIKLFIKQSLNARALPFIPTASSLSQYDSDIIKQVLVDRQKGKLGQVAKTPSEITNLFEVANNDRDKI